MTIARIQDAGIHYFNEGAKGFFRDRAAHAPYNLFTDLSETATLAEQDEAERPADYLPWGDDDGPARRASRRARSPRRSRAGTPPTGASRTARYVNENTYAAEGDEFPADTVLVLRVQVGDAGYRDPAGNPVPETKFTGTGPGAALPRRPAGARHSGPRRASARRSSCPPRPATSTVPAGHTWIELVPPDGGDVTFAK